MATKPLVQSRPDGGEYVKRQHIPLTSTIAFGALVGLGVLQARPTPAVADPSVTGTPGTGTPVTTTPVRQSDWPVEIDTVGSVQALKSVTVHPQVSGQLLALAFHEGQTVQLGQMLARIDPRLFQAAVDEDNATIAKDRALLANETINMHRYGPLSVKGLVSTQEYQTQQAKVAQMQAQISVDQAALDRDQVRLGFTSITSPINGVAGLNLIDAGNVVTPQDPQGLVVVTQIEPIAVLFAIPQAELPQVQLDLQSSGAAGLTVAGWSQDGTHLLDTGTLLAINNHVDPTSGTVILKAIFPNQKHLLWPGEFVNARLVLHLQHDALSVPINALQQGPSGPFVWTVASNGTAQQVNVSVTQSSNGQALIGSGLTPGAQVVTNGQYGLVAGTKVAEQKVDAGQGNSLLLRNNHDNQLGIVP
jgi:membrane fusion protein, multidrug efflux system